MTPEERRTRNNLLLAIAFGAVSLLLTVACLMQGNAGHQFTACALAALAGVTGVESLVRALRKPRHGDGS